MNDIIEQIKQNPDLAESYKEILKILKGVDLAKTLSKEAENNLRADIAIINGAYKKDGTTADEGSVKMASLNGALDVMADKTDKLEEAAGLKDDYLALMKNGEITKAQIDGISTKRESLKEAKENVKDTVDQLKTFLDSEIVDGLMLLANEELILIKESEGENVKKPKKTISEEVVIALKEKLGKI